MSGVDHKLELDLFKKLIKERFGIDFFGKNEVSLTKAINFRIKAHALADNPSAYYHKLVADKYELQELICLLTINETYFYREAVHLKFLIDSLVPKIRSRNRESGPIRILSMGCSTGAEPYSIAMTLHQKMGSAAAGLFTIMGVDVDAVALKTAKAAHYGAMSFRTLTKVLQQRYFVPGALGSFTLKPEIRDMVSFSYMNIVSESIAPEMQDIDVIFFRNVSIYFDRATRITIQKKIISMLKPAGYLIVGITESLANDFGLLSLKSEADIFYFEKGCPEVKSVCENPVPAKDKICNKSSIENKKTVPINSQQKFKPLPVVHPKPASPKSEAAKKTVTVDKVLALMHKKDYVAALLLLQNISSDNVDIIALLLLRSFILFNRQLFDKAREDAQQALVLAPFSVDGFLLQGMIARWEKQTSEAIRWFKKALYVQTDCWPAHYYLAGLYRDSGILNKATQEYRLVLKQLENPEENFCSTMTIPLSLPKAEIRMLCQSCLAKNSEIEIKSKILQSDFGVRNGD
ncbi:hypothetical protein KAI46_16590 [bacterium]|nr:hypothetical protein [bacterium]